MKQENSQFSKTEAALFVFSFLILLLFYLLVGTPSVVGDDTWAATAVLGNLLDTVVFTLRFDIHPPVYYVFIYLWGIAGKSDLWLLCSSLLIHAAIVASTYYIAKRQFNPRAAIIAAMLIFSAPILLDYAAHLRMYPLLALESLWLFYFSDRYAKGESDSLKGVVISGLLLANTQILGILFVFVHFLYGLAQIIRQPLRRTIHWCISFAGIAALSLPTLLNTAVRVDHRSIDETIGGSLIDLLDMLLLHAPENPLHISLLLSAFLLTLLLSSRVSRRITVCYLLVPMALILLISISVKMIWLSKNFTFMLPMLAIALGAVLSTYPVNRALALALPVLMLIINLGVWQGNLNDSEEIQSFNSMKNYVAAQIDDNTKTCVITSNQIPTFWSLARYLDQPEWGDPLNTQPQVNARWQSMIGKLPDKVATQLKLIPRNNYLERESLVLSSGWSERCRQADITQIILVDEQGAPQKDDTARRSLLRQIGHYSIYRQDSEQFLSSGVAEQTDESGEPI